MWRLRHLYRGFVYWGEANWLLMLGVGTAFALGGVGFFAADYISRGDPGARAAGVVAETIVRRVTIGLPSHRKVVRVFVTTRQLKRVRETVERTLTQHGHSVTQQVVRMVPVTRTVSRTIPIVRRVVVTRNGRTTTVATTTFRTTTSVVTATTRMTTTNVVTTTNVQTETHVRGQTVTQTTTAPAPSPATITLTTTLPETTLPATTVSSTITETVTETVTVTRPGPPPTTT